MTPEERERRAILWNKVERLLFSPAGKSDQTTWCACFLRSLARYWEVDEFAVPGSPFPSASFRLPPLSDFSLSYDLAEWGSNRRSSLWMMFKRVVFASYHIDHQYQDRVSLSDPPPGNVLKRYRSQSTRSRELLTDIHWVMDRYLLHPCTHLHPEPDALRYLGIDYDAFRYVLHEVRLGFGIANPFALLFQFRMNLVLGKTPEDTQARKERERNRVADLIHDEILNGGPVQATPPGKLFDLQR